MKKQSQIKLLILLTTLFLAIAISSCQKTKLSESEERKNEIEELNKLLHNKWANRDVEFVKNNKYIDNLFKQLKGEDLNVLNKTQYVSHIDKIIRGLHDGHLRLTPPDDVQEISRYSGMKIARVKEGYALVACDYENNCKDLNIASIDSINSIDSMNSKTSLPLEVIKIDDTEIDTWLLEDSKYQYGSTLYGRISQSLERLYSHVRLPYYIPAKTITLRSFTKSLKSDSKFNNSSNDEFTKEIKWKITNFANELHSSKKVQDTNVNQCSKNGTGWTQKNRKCVVVTDLKNGIYQLKVSTFWCAFSSDDSEPKTVQNFKDQFNSEIKKIENPKNIILDLRDNGGGGDEEGRNLAGLFIDDKEFWIKISHLLTGSPWYLKLWSLFDGEWQKPLTVFVSVNKEYRKKFINSKLFILTNNNCFSTCDVVVSSLKSANAGLVVGERTHGGAGDPNKWTSPYSNFTVDYPTALVWKKNGELIEGNSTDVDLEIIPSINDYKQHSDPVLMLLLNKIQMNYTH
ncbi:MAG: hypothetical protein HQK49_13745 [Oligoflexia bacterium]|nr:hypothetical protein [Oligoflexia bacterium]